MEGLVLSYSSICIHVKRTQSWGIFVSILFHHEIVCNVNGSVQSQLGARESAWYDRNGWRVWYRVAGKIYIKWSDWGVLDRFPHVRDHLAMRLSCFSLLRALLCFPCARYLFHPKSARLHLASLCIALAPCSLFSTHVFRQPFQIHKRTRPSTRARTYTNSRTYKMSRNGPGLKPGFTQHPHMVGLPYPHPPHMMGGGTPYAPPPGMVPVNSFGQPMFVHPGMPGQRRKFRPKKRAKPQVQLRPTEMPFTYLAATFHHSRTDRCDPGAPPSIAGEWRTKYQGV